MSLGKNISNTLRKNEMKNYIFGSGGFAKEVELLLRDCCIFNAFFVDLHSNSEENTISEEEFFNEFLDKELFFRDGKTPKFKCFLTVGNSKLRQKMFETICDRLKLTDSGQIKKIFPTVIHPSSKIMGLKYLNPYALGIGTIICANVVVTSNIEIGNFCNLNLHSDLGHDVTVGNYCTFSPGSRISGNCSIGNHVFFGTNSCTVEGIKIADSVKIGAGAVVTRDIEEENSTWVGVPAKRIK